MDKRRAIKALEKQRDSIENNFLGDVIWINQTLSFYEAIFGKESNEYTVLETFSNGGTLSAETAIGNDDYLGLIERTKGRLKKKINADIDTLKIKGIKKSLSPNIFSSLSNKEMIGIIVAIAIGAFSAGLGVAKILHAIH